MTNPPDYANIKIPPENIDRKKLKCEQRRAELLQIALAAGYLDAVQPTLICKRYGVNHSQISHDKKALREYINEYYWKPEQVKSQAITASQRALKGALKEHKWAVAGKIAKDIMDMGFNLGIIEKAQETIVLDGKVNLESKTLEELLKNKKHAP